MISRTNLSSPVYTDVMTEKKMPPHSTPLTRCRFESGVVRDNESCKAMSVHEGRFDSYRVGLGMVMPEIISMVLPVRRPYR